MDFSLSKIQKYYIRMKYFGFIDVFSTVRFIDQVEDRSKTNRPAKMMIILTLLLRLLSNITWMLMARVDNQMVENPRFPF